MRLLKKICLALVVLALVCGTLISCDASGTEKAPLRYVEITNAERVELLIGETFRLEHNIEEEYISHLTFSVTGSSITVSPDGLVTAIAEGKTAVTATYRVGEFQSSDIVMIIVEAEDSTPGVVDPEINGAIPTPSGNDPYADVSKSEFYRDYTPATSWEDAYYRTQHGLMSGSITVPEQMPTVTDNRPTNGGLFIKNTVARYEDGGKTYVVTDSLGNVKMRIYDCGAYITLEEVAAYMFAFGGSSDSLPANYTSKKSGKPQSSIWGEYLRVNHSYFSGDTSRYPYEPVLPNISGCGGSLQYYEMDIGTTGTRTPTQTSGAYNNGNKIIRGAARLVYGRCDINGNGVYEQGELYVFYTYNHYNDFMEYLNYYGGWGEVFGNTTGGGVFDSTTSYSPTDYPETHWGRLPRGESASVTEHIYIDTKRLWQALKSAA